MVWNYHDDDLHEPAANINLNLKNIPVKTVRITRFLIDQKHSNSYEVWKKMGSPQQPTSTQIVELEQAGMLQMDGTVENLTVKNGSLKMNFILERQGVELIKMDWK